MQEERFTFPPNRKPGPIINIIFNYESPNLTRDRIQYELARAIGRFRDFLELVEAPKTHIQETTGKVELIENNPYSSGGITYTVSDNTKEYTWRCFVPLRGEELYNLDHEVAGHGCFMGIVGPQHRYTREERDYFNRFIKEGIAELMKYPYIASWHKKFLRDTGHIKTLKEIIKSEWEDTSESYALAYLMMLYMRDHALEILKILVNAFFKEDLQKMQETLEKFSQAHNYSFKRWLGLVKNSTQEEKIILPAGRTLSSTVSHSPSYPSLPQNGSSSQNTPLLNRGHVLGPINPNALPPNLGFFVTSDTPSTQNKGKAPADIATPSGGFSQSLSIPEENTPPRASTPTKDIEKLNSLLDDHSSPEEIQRLIYNIQGTTVSSAASLSSISVQSDTPEEKLPIPIALGAQTPSENIPAASLSQTDIPALSDEEMENVLNHIRALPENDKVIFLTNFQGLIPKETLENTLNTPEQTSIENTFQRAPTPDPQLVCEENTSLQAPTLIDNTNASTSLESTNQGLSAEDQASLKKIQNSISNTSIKVDFTSSTVQEIQTFMAHTEKYKAFYKNLEEFKQNQNKKGQHPSIAYRAIARYERKKGTHLPKKFCALLAQLTPSDQKVTLSFLNEVANNIHATLQSRSTMGRVNYGQIGFIEALGWTESQRQASQRYVKKNPLPANPAARSFFAGNFI